MDLILPVFQDGHNTPERWLVCESQKLFTGFFRTLLSVTVSCLHQTCAVFIPLFRRFSWSQEIVDHFSSVFANGGCPVQGFIRCIGKIFLMFRGHMLRFFDRIRLGFQKADMRCHAAPMKEYFHCFIGYPYVHVFIDQIKRNRVFIDSVIYEIIVLNLCSGPDCRFK